MAIVGDAYVVVRAITSSVERDIAKAFNDVDRVSEKAGKDISNGVNSFKVEFKILLLKVNSRKKTLLFLNILKIFWEAKLKKGKAP